MVNKGKNRGIFTILKVTMAGYWPCFLKTTKMFRFIINITTASYGPSVPALTLLVPNEFINR